MAVNNVVQQAPQRFPINKQKAKGTLPNEEPRSATKLYSDSSFMVVHSYVKEKPVSIQQNQSSFSAYVEKSLSEVSNKEIKD